MVETLAVAERPAAQMSPCERHITPAPLSRMKFKFSCTLAKLSLASILPVY